MNKVTLWAFLLVALFPLSACIEEYELQEKILKNFEPEVVIYGRILNGAESEVYVTQTLPINSTEEQESLIDAHVTIIGQNGYESSPAWFDVKKDCYILDTGMLNPNTQYAVKVTVKGETYQSDFQPIQTTPEIDEVTYKEQEDGVSIHVSTHAEKDASRHYMWGFEEVWEFQVDIDILAYPPGGIIYNPTLYPGAYTNNPYLYCWKSNQSSKYYLYDTSSLGENAVKEHELLRIPVGDMRISYIYSVLVKQWSLTKEAYNYYRLLKLYTEDSGGLFAPIPSEVQGNIRCVSHPEKIGRGYVIASNITTKRLFVYASELERLNTAYSLCDSSTSGADAASKDSSGFWRTAWQDNVVRYGAVIITGNYNGEITTSSVLYTKSCADCTAQPEATNKRPDFWPNNH